MPWVHNFFFFPSRGVAVPQKPNTTTKASSSWLAIAAVTQGKIPSDTQRNGIEKKYFNNQVQSNLFNMETTGTDPSVRNYSHVRTSEPGIV